MGFVVNSLYNSSEHDNKEEVFCCGFNYTAWTLLTYGLQQCYTEASDSTISSKDWSLHRNTQRSLKNSVQWLVSVRQNKSLSCLWSLFVWLSATAFVRLINSWLIRWSFLSRQGRCPVLPPCGLVSYSLKKYDVVVFPVNVTVTRNVNAT